MGTKLPKLRVCLRCWSGRRPSWITLLYRSASAWRARSKSFQWTNFTCSLGIALLSSSSRSVFELTGCTTLSSCSFAGDSPAGKRRLLGLVSKSHSHASRGVTEL
uniref:IP02181p n=1 Tax=Drosophila melanogaster TaxID=7227 RepID=Q29QF4_DROME|nr:IP02181p [Drosophila melanogaster]